MRYAESGTTGAKAGLREHHGEPMFHSSGHCNDGGSPMCYPRAAFPAGHPDVMLGETGGCPFYMSRAPFEHGQHTHLAIDVVPGRAGMFSLERPTGKRLLIRSRLITAEATAEFRQLPPPWTLGLRAA